jgi:GT2 family glycosyltransferase
MKTKPAIAIIIVNWNGRAVTHACLESLCKVTYSNFKIFVVDNHSQDDSVCFLRKNHPGIELIESDTNRFFAGGNNLGAEIAISQMNPDYLLFLNNDTEVAPDFLEPLVSVLESDQRVGMAGPKIYHFEQPDLIWSAGGYVHFFRGKIGHYGLRQKDSPRWNKSTSVDYLTGCAQLIRSTLFQELKGFAEDYRMYSEDVDLCWRLQTRGYTIIYVPASKIWHKISSSSGGGLSAYKVRYKLRSNLLFFHRYARWYHWLTIPIFTLLNGIVFFFVSLFHLNSKAILATLRGLIGKKEIK